MWGISRLANELLDSQEGLWSVELQYIPEGLWSVELQYTPEGLWSVELQYIPEANSAIADHIL
jgi:hypothetical protein